MSDESQFRTFVRYENRRQASLGALADVLRSYHMAEVAPTWPEAALPFLADVTFSDGAAFLTPTDDGTLSIVQGPAATAGEEVRLGHGICHGEIWRVAKNTSEDSLLDSHVPKEGIAKWGVLLPAKSSLIVLHIHSMCRPESLVSVWRADRGKRPHSADAYQAWDIEALRLAVRLVCLTIDGRLFVREAARLRSVRLWARAFAEVIKPKLVCLHELGSEAPLGFRSRLEEGLASLDAGVQEIERQLLLEIHPGNNP